jgi:hypothetical protein
LIINRSFDRTLRYHLLVLKTLFLLLLLIPFL